MKCYFYLVFVHPLRLSATVNWIDVFTRDNYFCCIVESLDYCRKKQNNENISLKGICNPCTHSVATI